MNKLINGDANIEVKKITKYDALITDPPYNISKKNNLSTMNGNRKGVDFGDWDKDFNITSWIKKYFTRLKDGGTIIIFCSFLHISKIVEELNKLGAITKDLIKWIKTNPMPRNRNRRYVQDTEFAIWAVKGGAKWTFNREEEKYKRASITTPLVMGKERLGHPTQKSLKLMKEIIKTHTNPGDVICDPFAGTATTCLAARELDRKYIGIEKNKEYFEIAKERLLNEK